MSAANRELQVKLSDVEAACSTASNALRSLEAQIESENASEMAL